MSVQISEATVSSIDGTYLTYDGTASGQILLAILEADDWSPIRRNVGDVLGLEIQQFDVGGSSGTLGRPIKLRFAGMPNAVYADLRTSCDTADPAVAVSLTLAIKDDSNAEVSLSLSSCRWVSLTHNSAPDFTNRMGAGIVREVVAYLVSEA